MKKRLSENEFIKRLQNFIIIATNFVSELFKFIETYL